MNTKTFNPPFPGLPGGVIVHAARFHPDVVAPAVDQNFESVAAYPQFVLQSTWYDDMPPTVGAIWGGMPPRTVWDALAPRDTVRNTRGRACAVAYRTHGGQPFHYVVVSYDERGRVEAQLRLTENVGFDAVYYRYNAMNKITSVHVVDALGQHSTFYGYDNNGRISSMWTERSNNGLGVGMNPVRPTLPTHPSGIADATYGYDAADAITSIAYPRIGVSTTIDLNAGGSLLKSSTGTMTQTHFEQRLSYDEYGRIGAQWASLGTERARFNYNYDGVDRLIHEQYWNPTLPNPINEWRGFQYDRVGNRITSSLGGTTVAPSNQTYTYPPASNRLLQFTEGAPLAPPTRVHTLSYDPDGALQTRTRNDLTDGMEVQRIETFAYDAFELIHRYTVRRDVAAPGAGLGCAADAAQQPMDDWRYRFGPLQEREQKRQYATAGNAATDGLAWTYTLLGADAKQLATYNGLQGAFCGQPAGTVWMWPVEHNAWGPAGTRIIMRPTGAREYVVHDHLGSARLTYDNTGGVVERRSYRAFGVETQSEGEGARTSYIGREKDNESDLGFYGVRMYEPDYGRFLSVDPLWGLYLPYSPYIYCRNNPINRIDDSGLGDEPIGERPVTSDSKARASRVVLSATPLQFNQNGEVTGPATAYNCHSLAWSNGEGDPSDPANAEISDALPKWDNDPMNNAEAGWVALSFDEPNQIGDRLIYFNETKDKQGKGTGIVEPTHSAVVVSVDECGNANLVISKWGQGPGFLHHPRDVPDSYGVQESTAATTDNDSYSTRVYYRKQESK